MKHIYNGSHNYGYLLPNPDDVEQMTSVNKRFGELLSTYNKSFHSRNIINIKDVIQSITNVLIKSMLGNSCSSQVIDGDNAFATENKIYIGKELLIDKDNRVVNNPHTLLVGIVAHEICHIKFTNYPYLYTLNMSEVLKSIWNILEDFWIENKLLSVFPGLLYFLTDMKHRLYSIVNVENENTLEAHINFFLKYVRYPAALTEDNLEYFNDFKEAVDDIIKVCATSTQEAYEQAVKILELLSNKEFDKPSSNGKSIRPILKCFEGDDIVIPPNKSKLDDHNTLIDFVIVQGSSPNKADYITIANKYEHVSKSIANSLLMYSVDDVDTEYGTRSGYFNGSALSRCFITNDSKLYKQEEKSIILGARIILLIDVSGSMGGTSELTNIVKIEAAKEAAICIAEGIISLDNIELKIFGHTTETDTLCKIITLYENPDDKYCIASLDAESGNADGDAIKYCANLFDTDSFTTDYTKILIVISDGLPTEATIAGFDTNPIINTKKAVEYARSIGVNVIPIVIDSEASEEADNIYGSYIDFTDIQNLSINLPLYINKIICGV